MRYTHREIGRERERDRKGDKKITTQKSKEAVKSKSRETIKEGCTSALCACQTPSKRLGQTDKETGQFFPLCLSGASILYGE